MLRLFVVLIGIVLSSSASTQPSEQYPTKPIWIVVPYAAGGAVDIISRALAQELTSQLGQPVLVDNRPGAGGNIGSVYVAKSKPDGYILLMGGPSHTIAHKIFNNLTYDPSKDLVPIAMVGSAPSVLLVSTNLGIQNVAALVNLAKTASNALTYGHGGLGTTSEHLASELFQQRAGIKLEGVAYKGGAQAMQDLMGNQIQLMFTNLLNALPHIKSGRLKALAIAQPQRSAVIPDVATFSELGIENFNAQVWWGLMGPNNLPTKVIEIINQTVNASVAAPSFKDRLMALGAQVQPLTPQQFTERFLAEKNQWEQIVLRAKIEPQP
jgi:tripartite-type tricarboxylate transporter receptor subunit TctC